PGADQQCGAVERGDCPGAAHHRPVLSGLCVWGQRLPHLSAKRRALLFPEQREYGDVGGRRHYRVGGGGVEPGATDVAPEWESGFDLHGYDREPLWRQPRDRDLFTVWLSSGN